MKVKNEPKYLEPKEHTIKKWAFLEQEKKIKDRSLFIDLNNYVDGRFIFYILEMTRGVGKTYGATLFMINRFLKTGRKSVYIRRYDRQLKSQMKTFFSKLKENCEYKNMELRIISNGNDTYEAQIKNDKYKQWESFIFFCALNNYQDIKGSFSSSEYDVLIFDEFEIPSRYKKNMNYIGGGEEPTLFMELVKTIRRNNDDFTVVLLGNPVDITNPYYNFFKIERKPNAKQETKNGVRAYFINKNIDNWIEAQKQTKWGALEYSTSYGDYSIGGEVLGNNNDFIEEIKENNLGAYFCNIVINDITYKICDHPQYIYITDKNINPNVLTKIFKNSDSGLNRKLVDSKSKDNMLRIIRNAWLKGYLRFNSGPTKANCMELLNWLV